MIYWGVHPWRIPILLSQKPSVCICCVSFKSFMSSIIPQFRLYQEVLWFSRYQGSNRYNSKKKKNTLMVTLSLTTTSLNKFENCCFKPTCFLNQRIVQKAQVLTINRVFKRIIVFLIRLFLTDPLIGLTLLVHQYCRHHHYSERSGLCLLFLS